MDNLTPHKNIRENTEELPQSGRTAFLRQRKKKRRGKNTQHMIPPTHELKTTGGVGIGIVLQQVLFPSNLNSNAAPNYKHMFGTHKGPLPYQ